MVIYLTIPHIAEMQETSEDQWLCWQNIPFLTESNMVKEKYQYAFLNPSF